MPLTRHVTLSKLFAPNTSVDPYDVRQIKKILNRLGYYTPLETTGITSIPDQEIFAALKQFQKDHDLQPTGEIRPGDETEQSLSHESEKIPNGIYRWRSVEDGRVRKTHAQFSNTIRSWENSPDPGEDFNCRCWAESVDALTVNKGTDRIESILYNIPAIFDITIDTSQSSAAPLYEDKQQAQAILAQYEETVEKYAQKHGADADLIKAIMWSENSRGNWLGAGYVFDKYKLSKTIMPMNINVELWHKLITAHKDDIYDPEKNIEAGVVLVKRIRERIVDPVPVKVAAIWEFIGFEKTDDYAAYVERIYHEKPWKKKNHAK